MSVQLILFPQNYQGQYSVTSTPFFNEYVSDYSFNIGTLGTGFSGNVISLSDLLNSNTLPAPTNIWQQFNSIGGSVGVANVSTTTGGKVVIDCADSGTASISGIYQLISNLTIGATYEVKIQRLAGTTGLTTIGFANQFTNNGQLYTPILNAGLPATVGTHTFTFTATQTEQVFILTYVNNDNTNLEIGEVSIKESVSSAPTIDVFKDGQVICDLYDNSNLPLSINVDDFKNIHEKKQSFSKPFKLPATKRNNKIFSSLYDVTKSVEEDAFSFNPYKKTKAILKEDTFTIFDGYLTLIDIIDKDNEISYNVNLFAETITLADTLKDKKIKNLNNGLLELDHTYNKTNIKNTFTSTGVTYTQSSTSGFRNSETVKYPFCKWDGQTFLDAGQVKLQNLQDAFRPFINCKYLLNRIIHEAGFTYSSDFLDSTDFTKLYLDFNWGANVAPVDDFSIITPTNNTTLPTSGAPVQPFDTIPFDTGQIPPNYDTSTEKITADQDNLRVQGSYSARIESDGTVPAATGDSSTGVRGKVVHSDSSGNVIQEFFTPTYTINSGSHVVLQQQYDITLQNNETIEVMYRADQPLNVRLNASQSNYIVQTSTILNMNEAMLSKRGELGQYDFFKSILTMFNMIVIQDKDNANNLIIEPYNNVFLDDTQSQYITHKTLDWTSKVDISEIKFKPLKLNKTVTLEYTTEDKDYNKKVYKEATGRNYGTAELDASILTNLTGDKKITIKFGSTLVRPIFPNINDFIIPVIYEKSNDEEFTSFDNKPRILFDNGSKSLSQSYFIPAQAGEASENQSNFLQFSHFTSIPATTVAKDYNFDSQQVVAPVAFGVVDNLFNVYWQPYYDELYNADTKIVNIKIYLTPADIANFEFYYKIRIKNREYRVNKIDYKPYELSNVELILIP
mgnify:CR=1 FL=1